MSSHTKRKPKNYSLQCKTKFTWQKYFVEINFCNNNNN